MPAAENPDFARQLMAAFRKGSPQGAGKLIELFYPELRRLASGRMNDEHVDHTWQPTVPVHELYLQLIRIKDFPARSSDNEDERQAFFGLAAFLLRRLLIHHARPLPQRVTKSDIGQALGVAPSEEQSLHEIEDMLGRLALIDPKLRAVVEMKAFEGLTREEIADRLGCSGSNGSA